MRRVFSIVVCLLGIAAALPAEASATPIPSSTDPVQANLVVVMKSARELYLYRNGLLLAQYPIALGAAPIGTKHRAGDDKTPIGAYTLDWRNPDSRFHLSLHVSYPDARDLAYAAAHNEAAGADIMIHGQPTYDDIPRSGDWTDGCIAVSDAAIDQIWQRVPVGTPIHIYP